MVIDNDKTGNKEHHEFTPMRHRALSLRQSQRFTVTKVLQIFFELTDQQAQQLDQYSDYYEEYELQADTLLFALMDDPDCFYLVLGVNC